MPGLLLILGLTAEKRLLRVGTFGELLCTGKVPSWSNFNLDSSALWEESAPNSFASLRFSRQGYLHVQAVFVKIQHCCYISFWSKTVIGFGFLDVCSCCSCNSGFFWRLGFVMKVIWWHGRFGSQTKVDWTFGTFFLFDFIKLSLLNFYQCWHVLFMWHILLNNLHIKKIIKCQWESWNITKKSCLKK